MDHFPVDQLADHLGNLSRLSPLTEDRFLILDVDLLRDLPMPDRRKLLKKARVELQRREIQERVDEIAEAFGNEEYSLVEVLSKAFPSDLLNFGVLTEQQKRRWLAKAEFAAVGIGNHFVVGDECIYFIGDDDGRVKIGYTTDLRARLPSLQTGSSRKLVVLLVFPGHREKEADLHSQFSSDRLLGEWFTLSPAMQNFMDDIKSRGIAVEAYS